MHIRLASQVAMTIGLALASVVPAVAQAQATSSARSPKPEARKTYTAPKTAWGDPDLQGNYTNKDESGIPFERPSEFEGKKIDERSPHRDAVTELLRAAALANDAALVQREGRWMVQRAEMHWIK